MNSSIEIMKINQNYINENININIFEHINTLVFSFVLIEIIFEKFPNYLNPIGKDLFNYYAENDNENDNINKEKRIFFYIKNIKIIYFIYIYFFIIIRIYIKLFPKY